MQLAKGCERRARYQNLGELRCNLSGAHLLAASWSAPREASHQQGRAISLARAHIGSSNVFFVASSAEMRRTEPRASFVYFIAHSAACETSLLKPSAIITAAFDIYLDVLLK
jgi:hypothetical protein